MSAKFFPAVPDYIRGWYRLRTERKAALIVTEEMSRLPDDMLNDMGIRLPLVIGQASNSRSR